jgi:glycosyltransferase involved in cell wall biosynthesis
MKKKIIVSVTNDIFTDQRVRRICEFLVQENYKVTVVGRKLKTSKDLPDFNFKTVRFPLWFTKGALFYATYNLRLFFYLFFHKADVLLANDLDTLYANHWARKFKRNCRLVYDSHEYFTGVPELMQRPKIQQIWQWIEKKTLPKVDAMYTVNQSIADLYEKQYSISVKVVRNISDFNLPKTLKTRAQLGLPEDKRIVIMQGAGINVDRGAEEMIEAIQLIENTVLIFVGDGDVIPMLKERVSQNNWQEKVLFFGKRSYNELMNFTMLSDVGVSLDKDTNINYRFSLPNKLFDFIHAGIPAVVSNLKEVAHIVNTYEVGLVTESHEINEIAAKVRRVLTDKVLRDRLVENTKIAAEELNWAAECEVLKTIY